MANELILAVDDEAHILELLSFNLEASGYRVVTAATGEDALVVCAHERPAMVLLDIMLPGIDGMEVCRRLKEFELLKLLVLSRGKVLTRDFLLDRIWGYEFYGETRTVDVHIRHIRQKLGDDAHYIETIRGVGYKFNDRQENRL